MDFILTPLTSSLEDSLIAHVSMGGGADSFYEYLLKSWIQTQDQQARQMYDEAMDAFVANDLVREACLLLDLSPQTGRSQATEIVTGIWKSARTLPILVMNLIFDPILTLARTRFRFTDTAEAFAVSDGEKYYILRPEVIESYFILYRLAKDPKYRDWAWDAAQAIEKYTKAGPGRGYSGLRNVYSSTPVQDDVQQTFFLAETLKYLYLVFSTDDLIDLDKWVFDVPKDFVRFCVTPKQQRIHPHLWALQEKRVDQP
ncbi:unnamed protein product [Allacma fusca]|uniref:Alpha-1,2-Mannosidase n=1 Tax=Allacma fusca TaxID=39272 RepID=A0A8J2NW61_9HEXA|nr:unnamed protein product [Allacma fusca]